MKILWFSNCLITEKTTSSGTWLSAMGKLLLDKGVDLYNIAGGSSDGNIQERNFGGITQWALPDFKIIHDLPSTDNIRKILKIVDSVSPDLIHIWGMESYWASLYTEGYLKGKVLLEIQGIRSSCADVCYGGLTRSELFSCIGTKEILKPSCSIFSEKKSHLKQLPREKKILSSFIYISTQSEWTRARISPFITRNTNVFCTERCVRDEFIMASCCDVLSTIKKKTIVTVSSGAFALKGVHVLIKALAIVKNVIPDVKLKIIGGFERDIPYWRQSGYAKFLFRLIEDLKLRENVFFVGRLKADEMVDEMSNACVFVQSSFVESYSLALAEAMVLGLPCVVSYAGAMPCLAKDKEDALFYNSSDFYMCANNLIKILTNPEFACQLSENAFRVARTRNDKARVLDIQLSIYEEIVEKI